MVRYRCVHNGVGLYHSPVWVRYDFIQNGAGHGVAKAAAAVGEDARVDALRHHNEDEGDGHTSLLQLHLGTTIDARNKLQLSSFRYTCSP